MYVLTGRFDHSLGDAGEFSGLLWGIVAVRPLVTCSIVMKHTRRQRQSVNLHPSLRRCSLRTSALIQPVDRNDIFKSINSRNLKDVHCFPQFQPMQSSASAMGIMPLLFIAPELSKQSGCVNAGGVAILKPVHKSVGQLGKVIV